MSSKIRVLNEMLQRADQNGDGKLTKADVITVINRELGPTMDSVTAVCACVVCMALGLIIGAMLF